ncbi:MAG TPA: hypothetical protein VII98_05270 [Solirubrobacteraceae bacterium]
MAHHEMQVQTAGDPSRAAEIVRELVDAAPEVEAREGASGSYELTVTQPDMTWDEARIWMIERATEIDHEAPVHLDLLRVGRVSEAGG